MNTKFFPACLAAIVCAALALSGCASKKDDAMPKEAAKTSAAPAPAPPMPMEDMKASCDMHKKMMAATPEARQAMMDENMKGMTPEMREKKMAEMQEQCK